MNALKGIATVAKRHNRPRIVKWCAIKRHQQLSKEWEKKKAATVMVAIESFDLDWEFQG